MKVPADRTAPPHCLVELLCKERTLSSGKDHVVVNAHEPIVLVTPENGIQDVGGAGVVRDRDHFLDRTVSQARR